MLGQKIEDTVKISKSELKKIDEVVQRLRLERYTENTIRDKYKTPLMIVRDKLGVDFLKAKKQDIRKLNEWISFSDYSINRKGQLRSSLKYAYLVWLNKIDDDEPPRLILSIKMLSAERKLNKNIKPYKIKLDKLIRTPEQLKEKILDNLREDRDKFYFSLRFECGARCCEAEEFKWENIFESENITKVRIKTAKNSGDEEDRTIPLLNCLPYLNRWKRQYMELFSIKSEAELKEHYVFRKKTDKENKPICHAYYSKLCRKLRGVTGINDLSPKMFRKYAISRWQRLGIPEAIIKKMSGHSKRSTAIAHYSYHEQEDVDSAVLKMNGIKKKETAKENYNPIKCSRCYNDNIPTAENCEVCNFPLNQKGLISYEDKSTNIATELIKNNSSFKQKLFQQLKEEIIGDLRKEFIEGINL